jgi:short-subunit dehydrogenase
VIGLGLFSDSSCSYQAGASSGIGEAIAVTYASQGCHIVLAARRQDKLLGVAENCQKAGGTALCVECDVTKPADRAKLAKAAVDFANTVPGNTGVVHRLFLNAGVSQNSKFADLAESTEDEMMELNFLSNVRCSLLPFGNLNLISS